MPDSCWLVLICVGLVLTRVDSCRTRVDSCLAHVDSCRTRVELCWYSCIRIDLILEICYFLKVLSSFNSSNMLISIKLLNHLTF